MSGTRLAGHYYFSSLLLMLWCVPGLSSALAQDTAFSYQGRLTDAGMPANGTYEMQFTLFDMLTGGIQQGTPITNSSVQVTNGVFSVQLDFGASVFTGGTRYLEVGIRPAGSPNPYILLAPRQMMTSTPYTIRSISAGSADTATNATQLGGISSGGFIQNSSSQQAGTNFNISGNGTLGGTMSANVVNATTQYNLNGNRVLTANGGLSNVFVGLGAGTASTTGFSNTFVGAAAGAATTTSGDNSFFGRSAGLSNTTGGNNSFFGSRAGQQNTTGTSNSFFGQDAGTDNTIGRDNAVFGVIAGSNNTTGSDNSFFGNAAGFSNTTGRANAFYGRDAGSSNTTANDNSFFGAIAGQHNLTGASNSFFGHNAGRQNTTGTGNTIVGADAGLSNTGELNNTFIGYLANGATGITNATAVGANAVAGQSNSLVLGSGANVGIGTSFPAGPLHILGPASVPLNSLPSSQNGLVLGLQSTSGYKWIQSYGGSLVLNPTGNLVGIGTSAPAFTLDVAGPAHASSFPTSSDARLKTNISTLTGVLDKIERIRGVAFDWNKVYESLGRSTGHREIGVVAQEVEEVFPELVTRWGEQGYRAVDYGRLTAVLVEAVKELRAEKDKQFVALKAERVAWQKDITDLQRQNAALYRRLIGLQRMISRKLTHRPPASSKRRA